MFSTIEDSVSNMRVLRRWIRDLEEDEGLRIVGKVRRFTSGGFLFIGFHQGKYRVNICDRIREGKKRTYAAAKGGEWYEFDSFDEVWSFVRPMVRRPVRAWVY